MTIAYLATLIPADKSLSRTLAKLIPIIGDRCQAFRELRNRRIGHSDLDTRLAKPASSLRGISIRDASSALRSIAKALNAVERFYDNNEQRYDLGIAAAGDYAALLDLIRDEQKLRRHFDREKYGNA